MYILYSMWFTCISDLFSEKYCISNSIVRTEILYIKLILHEEKIDSV